MAAPAGKPGSPGLSPMIWVAVVVAVGALAFLGWRSNQSRPGAAPVAAPAEASAPSEAPPPPQQSSDLPPGALAG